VEQNAVFTYYWYMDVPNLWCAGYGCGFYGFPFSNSSLMLKHGGSTYTIPPSYPPNPNGYQSYYFRDGMGNLIKAAPGDTITVGSLPLLTVPKLTGTITYSTDLLSGLAPKDGFMSVSVYDVVAQQYKQLPTLTTAAGTYEVDFSSYLDLIVGRGYQVNLYWVSLATGNEFARWFTIMP
jgi:hypothetical protein